MLMVDAILKDETRQVVERTSKATEVIQSALDVFTEVARTLPNRQDVIALITAQLEAK